MHGSQVHVQKGVVKPQPSAPVRFGKENTGVREMPRRGKYKPDPALEGQLSKPSKGRVRAVASDEARRYHSWYRFERTKKVLDIYCGVAVGFFRYHVEEYIRRELQRAVNARLDAVHEKRKKHAEICERIVFLEMDAFTYRDEIAELKQSRAAIYRDLERYVMRRGGEPAIGWKRWLQLEAEAVIYGIRDHILKMVQRGATVRKGNHKENMSVLVALKGHPTKKIWVIINPYSRRHFIVTVKTLRQYKRGKEVPRMHGRKRINEPHRHGVQRKKSKRKKNVTVSKTAH